MGLEIELSKGSAKDLSLIGRIHVEKPGMVVCVYNPSAGDAKTSRFLGLTG